MPKMVGYDDNNTKRIELKETSGYSIDGGVEVYKASIKVYGKEIDLITPGKTIRLDKKLWRVSETAITQTVAYPFGVADITCVLEGVVERFESPAWMDAVQFTNIEADEIAVDFDKEPVKQLDDMSSKELEAFIQEQEKEYEIIKERNKIFKGERDKNEVAQLRSEESSWRSKMLDNHQSGITAGYMIARDKVIYLRRVLGLPPYDTKSLDKSIDSMVRVNRERIQRSASSFFRSMLKDPRDIEQYIYEQALYESLPQDVPKASEPPLPVIDEALEEKMKNDEREITFEFE